MGRLFWKFLLFVWLAQLAGIVAVALLFWLTQPRSNPQPDSIDTGPGARTSVGAAGAILRYGGVDAFKSWASSDTRHPVYAVDDHGGDLLGRVVPSGVIAQARSVHAADPGSPLVLRATDGQQHDLLLFAAIGAGRGPEAAPPDRPPRGMSPGGAEAPRPGPPGFRTLPPRGPMIATLLASLFTAALLAWYVAKPIRSLRSAFEVASAGRLDHRVAPLLGARQDELADLGRGFDHMAERLQESMSRQRRLLHDVSHEVRSPLARLDVAVGILRQKGSGDEATVCRIEEEIARIDHLVGDLLKLSRLEAGDLAGDVEEVDMHDLVSQVVSDANFEAQASGRHVDWTRQARATLLGRPAMLHVAFENLVRNALKHAPGTDPVTIETTLDASRTHYSFRVLDTGPGVGEDELPRLFSPFFRSEQAVSTEGYGLGLAIARRSIEAHGGAIHAQNRPTGGFCVEVVLPLHARLSGEDGGVRG